MEGGCREQSFGPAAGSVQQALCGRSRHPGVGVAWGSSLPPGHPAAAASAKPSSSLPPPPSPHPKPIWLPPVLFQKRNNEEATTYASSALLPGQRLDSMLDAGLQPPFPTSALSPQDSAIAASWALLPHFLPSRLSRNILLRTFLISPPREAFPESPGRAEQPLLSSACSSRPLHTGL